MADSRAVLARNLRRLMKPKGWQPRHLAGRARISLTSAKNCLSEKHGVQLGTLDAIAEALGVSAAELLRQ